MPMNQAIVLKKKKKRVAMLCFLHGVVSLVMLTAEFEDKGVTGMSDLSMQPPAQTGLAYSMQ